MKSKFIKLCIVATFLVFLVPGGKGLAVSNAEQISLPYYTCYGTSNIRKSSSYGDVYGESVTICDRTTSFPAYKIKVSGTFTRNGGFVDSDNRTYYNTDRAAVQMFYSDRIFRSGDYGLRSNHEVVSGYDHGDSKFWVSEWASRKF
ncbi:hypothetical protein IIE26_27190 (plasmid) [Cytobacillus oceanisediminis]|uniref:hypothetical protein n=1 Tax=Cytobacillus oceanisediminis TaxID=665099 RepID=UPI0018647A60|nr:hypothetical protein [Cytobacillus oceanisediminis]QOK30056.1 hypothetical protein IIE26_27190 [Cytobacillus oceanisediminis]